MKRTPIAFVVIAVALCAVAVPGASLAAPPSNDDFANATIVGAADLPYTATVVNTEATTEANEPLQCVAPPPDKTVWYSFTPSVDMVLRADTSGSDFSSFLEVFRSDGPGFGGLNGVQCQFFGSPAVFSATAGTTYLFQAAAFPFSSGGNLRFHLEAIPAPANDDFENATVVPSLPYSNPVDTQGADTQPGEPNPSCGAVTGQRLVHVHAGGERVGVRARVPGGLQHGDGRVHRSLAERPERSEMPSLRRGSDDPGHSGHDVLLPGRRAVRRAGIPPGQHRGHAGTGCQLLAEHRGSVELRHRAVLRQLVRSRRGRDRVGELALRRRRDGRRRCPTHRYAADGDYTVTLAVTTFDGRTASTQQHISVKTHDVAITKLSVPQSANAGQTRQLTIGLSNKRYDETVQVQLYKSGPNGFELIGTLQQSVPVRGGGRTTDLKLSYTFTSADAALGKVTFKGVAGLLSARDALPADNEAVALPTKVSG